MTTGHTNSAAAATESRAARLRRQRRRRARRAVALGAVAVVVLVVAALAAYAIVPERHPARATTAAVPSSTAFPTTTTVARAAPVRAESATTVENEKRGTLSWEIPPAPVFGISGFASRVSVQRGDPLTLYISTVAATYHIEAFRMGWYSGLGSHLVWKSGDLKGQVQPAFTTSELDNTVSAANWAPSLQMTIPNDWVPGDYLFKLVTQYGDSYIPLTIRDDTSHAAVLVINAVTTWQAYNKWGGYSLYVGKGSGSKSRARIVSFDRPYGNDGASEFIANELGLVTTVERMGLSVAYTTDVDVHEHPELLKNHKVIVSLGHDEYWSEAMRDGVEAARDAGVNVMFLGANALYRRIRLNQSPLGPDRLEVNYRSISGDTYYQQTHDQPTTQWRDAPDARPENSLTGTFYECNPVNVDGVVADANSWMMAGTGLHDGDHIKLLVGTEYDRVVQTPWTPSPIEVLLHSPLRCAGHDSFSDAAYYTTPSGAGVFDAGTGAWVCKLYRGCPADNPFRADPLIQKITENILRVFAAGPAGRVHPAVSNLNELPGVSSLPNNAFASNSNEGDGDAPANDGDNDGGWAPMPSLAPGSASH